MADVKRVEATIREDYLLTATLVSGDNLAQIIARYDFGFDVAHWSGTRSLDLATYGVQKFFARGGGSTPLHDHEAPGDIGDVRRFQR